MCIEIFEYYLEVFEETRERLPKMFRNLEEGEEPILWQFHPRMVFQRIMDFVARLKLIEDLFDNAHQLSKLEKIVVAGLKGRDFSVKIVRIMQDFEKIYMHFTGIAYDPLIPEDDSFVKDYENFKDQLLNLDKQLAAIAAHAFENCFNLISMFKMIQIWGALLDRPEISAMMEPKYPDLIIEMNRELDLIKKTLDEGLKNGFRNDVHFPPVAGKLTWLQKLRMRIQQPMDMYMEIGDDGNPIVKSEDSVYMINKYNQLMDLINGEQQRTFVEWARTVPELCDLHLDKPLLVRADDGTLLVNLNFDEHLIAILREVKYMKILELDNIPPEGLELFSRFEEFQQYITSLNRSAEWYNWLRTKTKPVELNLILQEVESIDIIIDEMIATLTWNDKDIYEQINNLHVKIKNLYERVNNAQQNLKNILLDMDKWALVPLYNRKDNKKDQLLCLEDRQDRKHKRYEKIQNSGDAVAIMLDENYRLFYNLEAPDLLGEEEIEEEEQALPSPTPVPSKAAVKGKKGKKGGKGKKKKEPVIPPEVLAQKELEEREAEEKERARREKWDAYQSYVDDLICEMFIKAAIISIGMFLDETDSSVKHAAPLFEVILELFDPEILFRPTLEINNHEGFYFLLQTLMEDIIIMGEMIPRVANIPDSHNYRNVIESHEQISAMIQEVMKRVEDGINKAIDYAKEFEKYSYLWLDNRQSFLQQFLAYGRMLTPEEIDMLALDEKALKETPPTIDMFKQQIDLYETLFKQVEAIETEWIANGWLRIDVRPLRQAILNNVGKWGNLFKQHLVEHVESSIKELEEFCVECDEVLLSATSLTENDYDGLLKVMEYLLKVKERQFDTDNMFQPLHDIIELLKQYDVEFPEEIHVRLAELPDKWTHSKKIAVTTKQIVGPLQTVQVNKLRKRLSLFETRQNLYKDHFKKLPLFFYDCRNVYEVLDKTHLEILDYENQLKALEESTDLFEINLPEFKSIRQVRKELKLLKQLWDYVYIVKTSIDEWKKTPWKKIDVEAMEMECKKFAKEIRAFDKEMRSWDTYIELEATVKNIMTSLRAVTELQNPAIRERHWQQLMQTTKVRGSVDTIHHQRT